MKSTLDLAYECGGIWRAGDDEPSLMCFTLGKLDSFTERIRADERASVALPAGMEPAGEVGSMPGTSGFTMACFHADKVPTGTKLYTASQVQAMLAQGLAPGWQAVPVERKPLTDEQISAALHSVKVALCMVSAPDDIAEFRRIFVRAIEAAHSITAAQPDTTKGKS